MYVVPLISVVSLAVIAWSLVTGYALQALLVMGVFMLMQATYSFLAILMDDEDMKLIIYSPLFVVGYKEVRNFVKLKSLLDVVLKREMKWGSLQRIGADKQS